MRAKRARLASSLDAEQRFISAVQRQGGQLAADYEWRGVAGSASVVCTRGHNCSPAVASVLRGGGVCRTCARRDPADAERRFLSAVGRLGARPAPDYHWTGTHGPAALVCSEGHRCWPRPSGVVRGSGLCRTCSRRDPKDAEARFLREIEARGGRPDENYRWASVNRPANVVCSAGHRCAPLPTNVLKGRVDFCRRCAGYGSEEAEQRFIAAVTAQGGTLAPGYVWPGALAPAALICRNGPACTPRPANVSSGRGICERCSTKHDRVYLMSHEAAGAGKVGIASGTDRISRHRRNGYSLVAEWDAGNPRIIERAILAWIRQNGWGAAPRAPKDGATETFAIQYIPAVEAWLANELGPAVRRGKTTQSSESSALDE